MRYTESQVRWQQQTRDILNSDMLVAITPSLGIIWEFVRIANSWSAWVAQSLDIRL